MSGADDDGTADLSTAACKQTVGECRGGAGVYVPGMGRDDGFRGALGQAAEQIVMVV